jgi:hypothetical protein
VIPQHDREITSDRPDPELHPGEGYGWLVGDEQADRSDNGTVEDLGADDLTDDDPTDDVDADETHVLPDEVEYPDHGGEPGSGLPPRVESWRRRSATGAMLTGFAFGLRDVLEPERRAPAIVLETSGVPPKDLAVEADLDNVPPRQSVVKIRRWLLTDGPDPVTDRPAAGEAESSDAAANEKAAGETSTRVTEIRRRETTRKLRFGRRGGKR